MSDTYATIQTGQCLFSAPFSSLGDVVQAYEAVIPTIFREIWGRRGLEQDAQLTAWVMNPGQHVILDDDVLDLYPNLAVLVKPSTGSNHIDLPASGGGFLSMAS